MKPCACETVEVHPKAYPLFSRKTAHNFEGEEHLPKNSCEKCRAPNTWIDRCLAEKTGPVSEIFKLIYTVC